MSAAPISNAILSASVALAKHLRVPFDGERPDSLVIRSTSLGDFVKFGAILLPNQKPELESMWKTPPLLGFN